MAEVQNEFDKRFKQFENFDLLRSPPSDHRYINTTIQVQKGLPLAKTISKEWRILKTSLPKSIYVRVYESRTDLMQAMIVGAQGTPYSDGLFFFDIKFPCDYPASPPQVYFHSHGLRLNPNLYENGFVCLSLLNTWHGSKKEKWITNQSTMLQLLVSLQGLVLNSEPYLNEPIRIYIFYKRVSLNYTKNAFMLTCRAMIYSMRMPPRDFRCFVEGHFRERAVDILGNCRANMDIGRSMREVFYELAKTFEAHGADCRRLVEEVRKEEAAKAGKMGLVMKIWNSCWI